MKYLAPLLLLLTQTAFGQGRDSVLAVHHLFAQKRGNGKAWTETGNDLLWGASPEQRALGTAQEKAKKGSAIGVMPLLVGWTKQELFSTERERDIIWRYQEGEALPADVRRKLRRRHFHRSALDLAHKW
jgi:hypothetical protein